MLFILSKATMSLLQLSRTGDWHVALVGSQVSFTPFVPTGASQRRNPICLSGSAQPATHSLLHGDLLH